MAIKHLFEDVMDYPSLDAVEGVPQSAYAQPANTSQFADGDTADQKTTIAVVGALARSIWTAGYSME